MTYSEIIKYIFTEEGLIFEEIPITNKCRQRPYVIARQLCMVIGDWFLNLTDKEATAYFNQNHATAQNAKIKIQNYRDTDKNFDKKFGRYLTTLRTRIDLEADKSKPGTIASRHFGDSKLQVEVIEAGYRVTSSKLVNEEIVISSIVFTPDGMRAVVDCFCELHSLLLSKKLYHAS
jgi:hypothetical protein